MPRIAALAVVILLIAAGCGDDATDSGSGTTADRPAAEGATVAVADSELGPILTTGDGMTLYRFTPDTGSASTCTGECAAAWPPLIGPATGDGVEDLGATTRDDGTEQVTVAGHPLYRYADDSAPGDVNGQGVGGTWYVVDASGETVTSDAGTATTAATKGGYGY